MIDDDKDNKYDHLLSTEHLQSNLGKRSVRSSAVTLASKSSIFVLTMISTIVLARLITPEDFGLFAMVAIFTSLLSIFKDLGLGTATIRKKGLTHAEVTNIFWINNLISLSLALVIVVMSPVVAWFYDDPRLTLMTASLSLGFIVSGLGIQHHALMSRQMRFKELAGVDIFSLVVGISAGIIAAYSGASYWTLVILQFVTVLVNTSLCWILCKWRPGLPRRDVSVRSMVFFGGNVTGSRLIGFFNMNLGNILIGRYVGAAAVGMFDRANQLLHLPVQQFSLPIGKVAIPALSSLQSEPIRFKNYYRYAVFFIGLIAFPVVFVLAVFATEVVLIILGSQWTEVTPIFLLLVPASLARIVQVALKWIYITLGRADKMLRWGGVEFVFNITFLLVGIQYGVLGVAFAFSAKALILILLEVFYCMRGTFLSASDLFQPLMYSFIYSSLAGATVWSLKVYVAPQWHPFLVCIAGGLIFLLAYLVLYVSLPASRKLFFNNIKKIRSMV
jgi:O-antigen/teichoic acid export membrane protein